LENLNKNNENTLTYSDKEIEEIFNILNNLGSTFMIAPNKTLDNAMYISRIFNILNSQILKRQQLQQNQNTK